MFKVNAMEFISSVECAAVGDGKGFVLTVNPQEQDLGNGQKSSIATISSSDGDKTGMTNVRICTKNMKKKETYFATASLRPAACSLSKITETIYVEPKGAYLELSDEKRESVIRVECLSRDIVLSIPSMAEDATAIIMEREKFAAAIRMGGYGATDSLNKAGYECIGFRVDVEKKELRVISMRSEMICQAVVPVMNVRDLSEKKGQWHMINAHFIQKMAGRLTGPQVQIGFNPKFMIVQSATGVFGSKKTEAMVPETFCKMVEDTEYDYSGKIGKKDLLTGMEIIQVGLDDRRLVMETDGNGTLKLTAVNGSNKTVIVQKEHEGVMESACYGCDVLKTILGSSKDDTFYYYGKEAEEKGNGQKKPSILHFSGESEGARYAGILAPVVQPKKEEKT